MTKPIILNGINVSDCKDFKTYSNGCSAMSSNTFFDDCSENPNCYFKQNIRTQAQNEELKKQNKLLQSGLYNALETSNYLKATLEGCKNHIIELEEQLMFMQREKERMQHYGG